ncbi:hypothetical protein QQF73_03425 [Marinobacter sp. M216]|uniref:TubC N-terminal docking domain-containing protein n=1 Tax=Marinobacter albus TaxID=3030833 RepID=A0ABT7H8K3_9GAMM|nr:hypothetical protein [Marinobacter sp. M216]MDK9556663.1 hypothetical protein [Marinobacter sp. M216]
MGALNYLTKQGLTAELIMGSKIAVGPAEVITPDLADWIVQHKPDLLEELQREQEPQLTPWTVMMDGKEFATLLSPCTAEEDVLRGLKERWPRRSLTANPWTREPS